jgi:hypothetical protein
VHSRATVVPSGAQARPLGDADEEPTDQLIDPICRECGVGTGHGHAGCELRVGAMDECLVGLTSRDPADVATEVGPAPAAFRGRSAGQRVEERSALRGGERMERCVRRTFEIVGRGGVLEQSVDDLCPEAVDLGEVPQQIGDVPVRT